MLYRTQHHSFFSPFPISSLSPHPPSSSLSPLSTSVQGMYCVEEALKSSFMPETPLKVTQNQAYEDALWASSTGQNVVDGEDFFVDDLLDFSNGFVEGEGDQGDEEKQQQGEDNSVHELCPVSISVSPQEKPEGKEVDGKDIVNIFVPAKDDFASLPVSDITVPADDLDSLEWLSHFVEDSFSGYSLAYPAGKLPLKPVNQSGNGEIPVQEKSCFATPVQTKARTKRGRTSFRVWPAGSGPLTESSSSSSSSTTTMSSSPTTRLPYPTLFHSAESPGKPLTKKPKKKPETLVGAGPQQPRRCSHCGVHKTPQWRAGPMGAKTLCNACGVRHKSGRLLPEYRPACSPTFSSELHSNNHRKVLEMRRMKESEESDLAQPVQSF